MDLRLYYRKIRETEAEIKEADTVVASLETPDGGRAGRRTEVPRAVAARMIVEGTARLATAEEAAEFREQVAEAKRQADQSAAANRVQLTVMTEADLKTLRGAVKTK